jgi:hypothetical protein
MRDNDEMVLTLHADVMALSTANTDKVTIAPLLSLALHNSRFTHAQGMLEVCCRLPLTFVN